MLRLVHPAQEGQEGTRPPKRRRRAQALRLTLTEVRHLRTSIKNIARALGGFDVLAAMIGTTRKALRHAAYHKHGSLSASYALAIARIGGTTVEAVLSGALVEAGRCRTCGSRLQERRAAS